MQNLKEMISEQLIKHASENLGNAADLQLLRDSSEKLIKALKPKETPITKLKEQLAELETYINESSEVFNYEPYNDIHRAFCDLSGGILDDETLEFVLNKEGNELLQKVNELPAASGHETCQNFVQALKYAIAYASKDIPSTCLCESKLNPSNFEFTKEFCKVHASAEFSLKELNGISIDTPMDSFTNTINTLVKFGDSSNALFASQLLINLEQQDFISLLDSKPKFFKEIQNKLKGSTDIQELLTLIALETRIYAARHNGAMLTEFGRIKHFLNTLATHTTKNSGISDLVKDLDTIKSQAPGSLSRLIVYVLELCGFVSSKPKSFFEENNAATLLDTAKANLSDAFQSPPKR
jgi:hypothetical protein